MMLQLNPPLPVETKEFGKGYAYFLIDYSQDHELYWVCFFDDSRICVQVSTQDIRIQTNYTLGRTRVRDKRLAARIILEKAHAADR